MARALGDLPSPELLPDPLPAPPAAPISYLGGFMEQIGKTSALSPEQQSVLLFKLKRGLRTPETFDDARTLLERVRERHDLLATIAEEIDELLAHTGEPPLAARRPSRSKPSPREPSPATESFSSIVKKTLFTLLLLAAAFAAGLMLGGTVSASGGSDTGAQTVCFSTWASGIAAAVYFPWLRQRRRKPRV